MLVFILSLATLNYFNLSSVFILHYLFFIHHYHAFNYLPIFYLFLSNTNRRCADLPEMSSRAYAVFRDRYIDRGFEMGHIVIAHLSVSSLGCLRYAVSFDF